MSYTFFTKEVSNDYSYLLLSVYHKGCDNCGSYYKGDDGEYIVSIVSGEKFYSVKDFVLSVKGMDMGDEWQDCFFYYEEMNDWVALSFI
jgi:hypothetical protein